MPDSMNSINKRTANERAILFLSLMALFIAGIYLMFSLLTYRVGFPLDDAWIHQTYARNLAKLGEWSFVPGQPSAGSTAPLWSVLLAVGHLLSSNVPYLWTYSLGLASLIGMAWLAQRIVGAGLQGWVPWIGLFFIGEWHLVWAALSGMETAWIGFLILLAFFWLDRMPQREFLLGLLIGVAVWVRPDGLTLLGPAGLVIFLSQRTRKQLALGLAKLAVGFAIVFAPYLLFNQMVNGNLWPNTFYAKQAEYAALLSQPLWQRLGQQFALPLTGAGLFLLPGFLFGLYAAVREKRWALLAGWLWFCGYASLYALRLPVVYQHGRYLMPAMPVYFLIGLWGTMVLLKKLPSNRLGFVLSRVWIASLALTWLSFLFLGARAYATDVSIIESEMVETAHWIARNTHTDDLIAAHDIGALGYYGNRKLIDLAGLISPDVIPFIRDEKAIDAYLRESGAAYLVTFPDWYPELVRNKEVFYQTKGRFSPDAGGENMAVYKWK